MGIASLVLGILSVLCSLFGFTWIAMVLGAVGIVLGALSKRNYGGGMATAGLVLSIIGASLGLVSLVACLAIASWAGKVIGQFTP